MSTPATTADGAEVFYVVHPLDDAPEEKRSPNGMVPMAMTPVVKFSLYTLRGYLIIIVMLALSHLAMLFNAGIHHAH